MNLSQPSSLGTQVLWPIVLDVPEDSRTSGKCPFCRQGLTELLFDGLGLNSPSSCLSHPSRWDYSHILNLVRATTSPYHTLLNRPSAPPQEKPALVPDLITMSE
ncbi:uncharacterized protein LOC144254850 [Urocitellus parryii]